MKEPRTTRCSTPACAREASDMCMNNGGSGSPFNGWVLLGSWHTLGVVFVCYTLFILDLLSPLPFPLPSLPLCSLVDWLAHSRKRTCELCKHEFRFLPGRPLLSVNDTATEHSQPLMFSRCPPPKCTRRTCHRSCRFRRCYPELFGARFLPSSSLAVSRWSFCAGVLCSPSLRVRTDRRSLPHSVATNPPLELFPECGFTVASGTVVCIFPLFVYR